MSTNISEVRAASIIAYIQLRTRQYISEDSELHTRRRENLKSNLYVFIVINSVPGVGCKVRQENDMFFVRCWLALQHLVRFSSN
jgi:hypothetical protein